MNVWLVLLCLASVPAAVFPIRYAGKHILRRAQQMQSQLGIVTDRFSENLGAAKEIRASVLEGTRDRPFRHRRAESVSCADEDRQILQLPLADD